jgi:hypothetical protein
VGVDQRNLAFVNRLVLLLDPTLLVEDVEVGLVVAEHRHGFTTVGHVRTALKRVRRNPPTLSHDEESVIDPVKPVASENNIGLCFIQDARTRAHRQHANAQLLSVGVKPLGGNVDAENLVIEQEFIGGVSTDGHAVEFDF